MELTKELKEKPENAKAEEESKKIMEDTGLELTDEEVEQVSGGIRHIFGCPGDGTY